MGDKGGWTVADTARIKKRSTTTPTSASSLPVKPAPFFPAAVSPTSVSSSSSAAGGLDLQSRNGVGGQSSFGREGGQQQQQQQQVLLPSPLTATSPTPSKVSSTSKDNHVRWSDSFRTKSEEDLDKLLDGLEELTETLPDLNRSNNRVVKKQLFHSIPDSDSVDKAFNATFSANHNNNHSTNRSNRGVTGAAIPSPVSQPNINSASSGYSSSATAVVRDSSNQHTRQPSPPHQSAYQLKQQELQQLQKQQIELQEQLRIQREQNQLREQEQQQQQQQRLPEPSVRINLPSSSHESDFDFSSPSTDPSQNPNGPVFPNVKKTRQLLQSRDTYNNSAGSVYSYAGSGTMESNGGGGASTSVSSPGMRQPYHTMQDSKPFSYIHINGGGGGGGNNGSRPPSRTMSRASSREALSL